MDTNKIYSDIDIQERLDKFLLWDYQNGKLVRELSAGCFADAINIVNKIAEICNSLAHYPDILIYGWNKIRVETKTVEADSVTELDFILAERIDELKTI